MAMTKALSDYTARMNAFEKFDIPSCAEVKRVSPQEFGVIVEDGNGNPRLVVLRAIVKTVYEDTTPEEELENLSNAYLSEVEKKKREAEENAREKAEKKKRDAELREKKKAEREAKKKEKENA